VQKPPEPAPRDYRPARFKTAGYGVSTGITHNKDNESLATGGTGL